MQLLFVDTEVQLEKVIGGTALFDLAITIQTSRKL